MVRPKSLVNSTPNCVLAEDTYGLSSEVSLSRKERICASALVTYECDAISGAGRGI
jgi:hypothetical protein